MRISTSYSHMNGEEYLLVHRNDVWEEVKDIIADVDAERCKTKISAEKTKKGKLLYSPKDMNAAFKERFRRRGRSERRNTFWVTDDEPLLGRIYRESAEVQREAIREANLTPIMSYNQTDFVKERVAVEVQFGKYSFVAHDLFVKHLSLYVSDTIDVGIEILPMKALEEEMSSGVPCYERDLLNVVRQGRGVPAVPLVLVGVTP